MGKAKKKLRSLDWFSDTQRPDQTALYLERFLNFGLTLDELRSGRPIIGIAQTGSDLVPCNRHHLRLAGRARDGVRDSGGVPLEFPVHPIFENARRPTAALDRNLATLGLIEILHGYPLDGVILMTGCDKTTPALLMAAACVDIPAIVLSGGPMLNGWSGDSAGERRVGSGQVIWEGREKLATGEIDGAEFIRRAATSAPSEGHCNTMGTALTMNCLAEGLGMSLPGSAAIPAPYRERSQNAYHSGRRIVELVHEDLKPSDIMTTAAFHNAIALCTAIGGSSNAPPHLQAISHYLPGVELHLRDWQTHGEKLPLLANCQPAGEYLGEDFQRAGAVGAVMGELLRAGVIHGDCQTVSGQSVGENYANCTSRNSDVIRSFARPLRQDAGFAVLSGNFFHSAIMKKSVIDTAFRARYLASEDSPECFTCRAVVFEGPEDYHARIDDPQLAIDEGCILVMRNCGPIGYPGSAEVVNMRPPDYLVKRGVTCLPTMGDGRQSGTSASPSILNISPESAAGGLLGIVENGDRIEIDLAANRVNLLLDDAEITRRLQAHEPLTLTSQTPWQEIYRARVNQLEDGAVLTTDGQYQGIHARHGTPRHNH
tara:strand:- start:567 stop:2363 length:1797 start_codon:yes stop_codon:yes gene_type:complete